MYSSFFQKRVCETLPIRKTTPLFTLYNLYIFFLGKFLYSIRSRLIFYSQESFYIFSFLSCTDILLLPCGIYNSHCLEYFLKILFFIFSLSHPKLGEDSIKARGCSSSRISTCSKKNGPLSTIGDSNPGFLTRKQVPNSLRHLGFRIDRFLFAIT